MKKKCKCRKKSASLNSPERKVLGDVVINYSKVNVFESNDEGVRTDFEKDGSTSVYVRMDEQLPIIISDIIHELMETKLLKAGCRYHRTDLPEHFEPISCMFVMNHDEFQLACHEVGLAITKLLPTIIKESKLNKDLGV